MTIEIYQLADVAAIVGIRKARAKNWSIGRPYTIQPSVQSSLGKGSRNLFSRNDLYAFALVKLLSDRGAPVEAIQNMLRGCALSEDSFWKDDKYVAIVDREPGEPRYIIAIISPDRFDYSLSGAGEAVFCCYAVHPKSIANTISTRIEMQKTSGHRREDESSQRPRSTLSPPRHQKSRGKEKRRSRTRKAQ